jgi:uncharacterized protein
MPQTDQRDVIAFLTSPSTHGGATVERIETHASIVFLAGERAWKLKRAVRYDYLDFSTPERRRAMCEAELRINRRAAPAIYLGVVPVTREAGGALALGGPGEPVDWVIEMARFDQESLFDRLAARQALDLAVMRPLASAIAAFHRDAERRPDHGGKAGLAWVIDGNASDLARHGRLTLDAAACSRMTAAARAALEHHADLLEQRRRDGHVRQCHGDLHLRNLVLLDGRPTLFDAVEFNDEISCTDVLYDLAFLLMDLWRRRLPRHANAVWNGYLAETGRDLDGLPLMPLFLSCRAAVRAKTSLTAARLQADAQASAELDGMAREYLALAERLLHPPAPLVVAVGGFSGSGKSTLARTLAPSLGTVPGAVVVRSDEIRKALCGVSPHTPLGPMGYTDEVTRAVYDELGRRVRRIVHGGFAAVVDAVHARAQDRSRIEQVAASTGVPFVGLWLDAPEEVLATRADRRRREMSDPSDADASVVRRQWAHGTGAVEWTRLDASRSPEQLEREAVEALRRWSPSFSESSAAPLDA